MTPTLRIAARSALALLLSCTAGFVTAATASGCRGTNLLDELGRRDPAAETRVRDAARSAVNSDAVLWRIEKDGVAPSYIFGTIHVADERLQTLPSPVTSAISTARVIAMEGGQPSDKAVRSVMPLAARMMMASGWILDNNLSEDEFAVVTKAVSAAGLAPQIARTLRPWAASLFLVGSECERRRYEAGLRPMDIVIIETARRRGLEPVALERILEQYEALAAIPDEAQLPWLRASIKLYDRIDDMTETMIALYQAARIDAVWHLTTELAGDVGLTPEAASLLRQELVDNRNERMFARAEPLIREGGAFIAVGAMHLSGQRGLVELAKRAGARVEPVALDTPGVAN